ATAILTATGGGSYLWSPGGATNNTINVNPNVNTLYIVTVTNSFGCSAKDTVRVIINPLPQPAFAFASACAGDTAIFTNSSTITSGTISSYSWNFGNGTSSTVANPKIVYASAGTYSVTLTVTSSAGCSAS